MSIERKYHLYIRDDREEEEIFMPVFSSDDEEEVSQEARARGLEGQSHSRGFIESRSDGKAYDPRLTRRGDGDDGPAAVDDYDD